MFNNVQANILPLHIPLTLGWGQKVKTFFSKSHHVAYKIKANEMYNSMGGGGYKFNEFALFNLRQLMTNVATRN